MAASAVERLNGDGAVPAHAQRGDAHDAAAAFAVVLRLRALRYLLLVSRTTHSIWRATF